MCSVQTPLHPLHRLDLETHVSTSLLPGQVFVQWMTSGFPHVEIGIIYYLLHEGCLMVGYRKGFFWELDTTSM